MMTVLSLNQEAGKLAKLIGSRSIRTRVGHAGVLLIDFDRLLPPDDKGLQRAEKELLVTCPWRIESAVAVIGGYLDIDDLALEQRIQVLNGANVIESQVYRPSFSFRLRFDNGLLLHGFPCDTDYYTDNLDYSSPWSVTGFGIPFDE